ncbi:phosphoglycerate kinase [Rubripirellula amarantea]|nr:phosphoglycerate kinase [Rubripirellula amarantea]
MGLDMYAYITTEPIDRLVDFTVTDYETLHYWRKHPNLHGWMEQLYYEKGGEQDFNCVPVVLTSTDIDQLEAAIVHHELPTTSGFFFGQSQGGEYENDLVFTAKARKAIAEGYTVYYLSWW